MPDTRPASRIPLRNPPNRARPLRRAYLPAGVLLQRASALRERIGASFYELGETLIQIQESEAWRSDPECAGFEASLRKYKIAGRTTAYKLMAIVRRFPRETALKMGTEVAYGMVRFSTLIDELLNIGIDPKMIFGDLDPESLSARELEAIIKMLREAMEEMGHEGDPAPPVPPVPPKRVLKSDLAKLLQRNLRGLGAKHAVTGTYMHDGQLWVRVRMPEAEWRFALSSQ